jgi:hypothetical protein
MGSPLRRGGAGGTVARDCAAGGERCPYAKILLRACANRRVAHVSRNSGKAVQWLWELPSMKSCQPISAASKPIEPLAMEEHSGVALGRQGAESQLKRLGLLGLTRLRSPHPKPKIGK